MSKKGGGRWPADYVKKADREANKTQPQLVDQGDEELYAVFMGKSKRLQVITGQASGVSRRISALHTNIAAANKRRMQEKQEEHAQSSYVNTNFCHLEKCLLDADDLDDAAAFCVHMLTRIKSMKDKRTQAQMFAELDDEKKLLMAKQDVIRRVMNERDEAWTKLQERQNERKIHGQPTTTIADLSFHKADASSGSAWSPMFPCYGELRRDSDDFTKKKHKLSRCLTNQDHKRALNRIVKVAAADGIIDKEEKSAISMMMVEDDLSKKHLIAALEEVGWTFDDWKRGCKESSEQGGARCKESSEQGEASRESRESPRLKRRRAEIEEVEKVVLREEMHEEAERLTRTYSDMERELADLQKKTKEQEKRLMEDPASLEFSDSD